MLALYMMQLVPIIVVAVVVTTVIITVVAVIIVTLFLLINGHNSKKRSPAGIYRTIAYPRFRKADGDQCQLIDGKGFIV